MAPTSGFYAIYDEQNQGVKLVDAQGYEAVKEVVTAGRPNIDGIDYEKCRDIMRFKPTVIRRRPVSPKRATDLVAVYEPSNQSIIAVTRADYEKNKAKYDQGPAPTLKPHAAAPAAAPAAALAAAALTPAFSDVVPVQAPNQETCKTCLKPTKAAAAPTAEIKSFSSLIFQPPKIGAVTLSPDDLVAVYDAATQSVIAITRRQYEKESVKVASAAAQKTSDLIFQPPKVGKVQLSPNDLLAVYEPKSQGVILVTRKQYDQGDIGTPAKIVASSAPQKSSDLIFQPPKVGKVQLSPNDLLAVYEPKSQGVILVTRKQYDQGDISTPAKITSAPASSAPQKSSDLIFQPPKVGKVQLGPDDLLAVYHPASQGVILVTRAQYDKGDISTPAKISRPSASAPQQTSSLIFQAPKIRAIKLCPDDLLAVYDPASQGVVLVTRRQYDSGELPAQSFANLIFQPPKVGPVQLGDDDLLAIYDPDTQSVKTITRKEYNATK